MERPARSRADMRRYALLLLLAGPGCLNPESSRGVPSIDKSSAALQERNGVLLRDGVPYSGEVVHWSGQRLLSRTAYRAGKRHGRADAWYPDGTVLYEKVFRNGDREGTHRGFWPNGKLQFVYRYEHDLFEGEQSGYYKSGVRFELRHFRSGHEEGQQTTWDGEGRLTANYTFKGGRRYGIVGRFDCVSVHQE